MKPIYKIETIQSSCRPYTWISLKNSLLIIANSEIILTQHHGVFTGTVKDGEVKWYTYAGEKGNNDTLPMHEDAHVMELRIFNKEEELYVWRENEQLKGRFRSDGKGEVVDIVHVNMRLRSVVAKRLFETLGTEREDKVGVRTRQYLDYDDLGQVKYTDIRFLEFKALKL